MSTTRYPILKLHDVLKRLQRFGITQRPGKETYMILEGTKLSSRAKARYVIDAYKGDRELSHSLLDSILRRFEISTDDFFEDAIH